MEFNTGEKVQLISGGPEMTVRGIVGDGSFSRDESYLQVKRGFKDGDIYCQWFNGSKLEGAAFRREMLIKL